MNVIKISTAKTRRAGLRGCTGAWSGGGTVADSNREYADHIWTDPSCDDVADRGLFRWDRFFEVSARAVARLRHLRIFKMLTPNLEETTVPESGPALSHYILSLRRYAMALVGNREDADDLVQECLARALARTVAWNQVRNVRAYLFTILHNLYVDRAGSRKNAGIVVPIETAEAQLSTPACQEQGLRLRDLERALRLLPEEFRQVVLLVGMEGMSYRDTATTLGVPVGTVMSRLSRGRETLRELMANDTQQKLRMVK
jgi:RNA polymerase sigma-70 factor (ECF subfamily)